MIAVTTPFQFKGSNLQVRIRTSKKIKVEKLKWNPSFFLKLTLQHFIHIYSFLNFFNLIKILIHVGLTKILPYWIPFLSLLSNWSLWPRATDTTGGGLSDPSGNVYSLIDNVFRIFIFSHHKPQRQRRESLWCGQKMVWPLLTRDTPGDCLRWSPFTGTLSRPWQNLFSPHTTTSYLHHTPHTYAASIRNTEENLSEFIQLTANKRSVNEYSNLLQLTDWCTQALSQLITRLLLSVVLLYFER